MSTAGILEVPVHIETAREIVFPYLTEPFHPVVSARGRPEYLIEMDAIAVTDG